ncbi:TnsA-like heteromeric transposase endonuclease subunit [Nocardia sp. CA-107356]|uniref:TnsA-like heteromeric transposase endonuclease subunit n=1 Tax=Nocardia sp. CA-107356 TaxID=3239972 RepID=UPI003D8B8E6C
MATGGVATATAAVCGTGVFTLRYLEIDVTGPVERHAVLTTCWGTRFEDVPPVRQFPSFKGQKNFPGLYFAACMGGHIGFESWLERDHLMLLDFSPQVTAIAAQPFWLSWPTGEMRRRHAPDFFVRLADGRGVVIDVRADDRIEDSDAEAFAATAAACESVGWGYRRVGTPEAVLVANVRWLAGYRHARCLRAEHRMRLVEVFSGPRPLLEGAEMVGDRLTVLPSVFHLLWSGTLSADLESAPLTGHSMVSLSGEGR